MNRLYTYLIRISLIVAALTATTIAAKAVPAYPGIFTATQPDGSTVELRLCGDEWMSFTTTADGYSVVRDGDGSYVYARLQGGQLVATGIVAHDDNARTAEELQFLSATPKMLRPTLTAPIRKAKAAEQVLRIGSRQGAAPFFEYSKFRGLVVLVEYNDCDFSRGDYAEIVDSMINQRGFSGYMTNAALPEHIDYTGSVRDYFYDNSAGLFDPHFDVVGPVKIDHSMYEGRNNYPGLQRAALIAADSLVNYKDYDTDGNGTVDMVYFIFAGAGSNFGSNDSRLLWPHASYLTTLSLDGVRFGRYACSTELFGTPSNKLLDGIGTICHEFSHVLGLCDEYDTDYSGSGGQSIHPGRWSVMASGPYLNNSRTPCGYSLFERYQAGFATPQLITEAGDYTLDDIDKVNTGYRINSAVDKEFFLLENRQQGKWNAYLPGHGMLVFRVDSTDTSVWTSNDINCNPSHNYYELLRVNPRISGTSPIDSGSDPLPGTSSVTELGNNTTPNLRSWTGMLTGISLSNIKETNGVITFSAAVENTPSAIEDFETMPLTTADTTGVAGRFCAWSLTGARIVSPDSLHTGLVSDHKGVAMVRQAVLESGAIDHNIQTMSIDVVNPTSQTVVFNVHSVNQNGTRTMLSDFSGTRNIMVEAGKRTTMQFRMSGTSGVGFAITERTGSTTDTVYLDNFAITYELTPTAIREVATAEAAAGTVRIYDMQGRLAAVATPQSREATLRSLPQGVYVLRQGSEASKVVNR